MENPSLDPLEMLGNSTYGRTLERKEAELRAEKIAKGENPDDISLLERLSQAPKIGEILTEDWTPESRSGQVGKEVVSLGTTMALDPANWIAASAKGATTLGKYALGGTRNVDEIAKYLPNVANN